MIPSAKRPRADMGDDDGSDLTTLSARVERANARMAALAAEDAALDAAIAELAVLSRLMFALRAVHNDPTSGWIDVPLVTVSPALLPSPALALGHLSPFVRVCVAANSLTVATDPASPPAIVLAGVRVPARHLSLTVEFHPIHPTSSWYQTHTISLASAVHVAAKQTWECHVSINLTELQLPVKVTVALGYVLAVEGARVGLPVPLAETTLDVLDFAHHHPLALPFSIPVDPLRSHLERAAGCSNTGSRQAASGPQVVYGATLAVSIPWNLILTVIPTLLARSPLAFSGSSSAVPPTIPPPIRGIAGCTLLSIHVPHGGRRPGSVAVTLAMSDATTTSTGDDIVRSVLTVTAPCAVTAKAVVSAARARVVALGGRVVTPSVVAPETILTVRMDVQSILHPHSNNVNVDAAAVSRLMQTVDRWCGHVAWKGVE
ncbi:hypothetical protein BC828DRAFT_372647 [Blastocladiella britannica]|nr:hypothetical protein BC828DRAFT_372647 [Blastocladiella britannica]